MGKIQIHKKHYYLGVYSTKEEAAEAYNEAAMKLFEKFNPI